MSPDDSAPLRKHDINSTLSVKEKEKTFPLPPGVFAQTVTNVVHYTDRLFKFRMTRPSTFRFRSGEFVMIGLPNAERPVYRAYSIASPSWDDELEFYSIKVSGGPLTEHLQKIKSGDVVLMRKKPTGTLVHDALTSGKRLYLFSTGTGIAPFASIIRDPETYEKFETIILTHTCRLVAELEYGRELVDATLTDPLVGDDASEGRLVYVPAATREEFKRGQRITEMLGSGTLFQEFDLPSLSRMGDRAMICGSMAMLKDVKSILEGIGMVEGSNSSPGDFVVERAFVD